MSCSYELTIIKELVKVLLLLDNQASTMKHILYIIKVYL